MEYTPKTLLIGAAMIAAQFYIGRRLGIPMGTLVKFGLASGAIALAGSVVAANI